jgi:hypothetical protein
MDKISNLIKHDPENGQWGDCYRCCVAMLLGLPALAVPHFNHKGTSGSPEERQEAVDTFLDLLGLVEISIPYPEGDHRTIIHTVSLNSLSAAFILSGMSRIGANHCVVCQDGEIFHDPSGNGIVGPMNTGYYLVSFFAAKPAFLKGQPQKLTLKDFEAQMAVEEEMKKAMSK